MGDSLQKDCSKSMLILWLENNFSASETDGKSLAKFS